METKLIVDTTKKISLSTQSFSSQIQRDTEISVERLLIERQSTWKQIPLNSISNLSNTWKIGIYIDNGTSRKKINVSKQVLKWIQDYLKIDSWEENEIHDCFYFARTLMWERNHPEGWYNDQKYNISTNISDENLSSGDVLQIHEIDESWKKTKWDINWDLFHFAIYIWDGFYISKCWSWWDIVITTLDVLKKIYPYNLTFIMHQKKSRVQAILELLKRPL